MVHDLLMLMLQAVTPGVTHAYHRPPDGDYDFFGESYPVSFPHHDVWNAFEGHLAGVCSIRAGALHSFPCHLKIMILVVEI